MADNVTLDAGSGGDVIAADDISSVKYPRSKITLGADGVNDGDVSSSNPMPVSAASLPLPSGAATGAKQDTGNTSLASIDGKITAVNTGAVVVSSSALPSGASTAAKQPALGTAGTASTDVLSIQGISGMTAVKVDGSGFTQPVSGSVTVSQGTATNLKSQAEAYQGGTAVGSGNPLQVTLANGSVPSHAVTNAGTFATQAQPTPVTSGGLTTQSAVGAASTNATVVKASAGQLYEIVVTNINASPVYFKLYNKATTPDENDTPVWRVIIPGSTTGGGFAKTIPMGLAFSTGIAYRLVGGIGDTSTTATSANEQMISLGYK